MTMDDKLRGVFDAYWAESAERIAEKLTPLASREWDEAREAKIAEWQAEGIVPKDLFSAYIERKLSGLPISGEQCRTCGGRVKFDHGYQHFDNDAADHPVSPMALNETLDRYYNPEMYS